MLIEVCWIFENKFAEFDLIDIKVRKKCTKSFNSQSNWTIWVFEYLKKTWKSFQKAWKIFVLQFCVKSFN